MQLKKIKLAGFKSFVDPTVVMVPSNLVAVVGPNGCGKSNIIDAVSWVMGESSAKYLRGESLTDVIFNGSTARKPVGQASVELVFDNQDGSLGGEYASYAEISIRRQISRDAESAYFLNGARCRRKDIIDIFLGTGLGPRSYSIIGQNMIARIIEAKPEDMRHYLEEAAGVSKYKERRRETENRIRHTKDNLARLSDLRSELEKQLGTLKRQASAAEKFQILKQEERVTRAQWLAIQWRELESRIVNESVLIQQQSTGLEARQAEVGEIQLQLEYQREAQATANEAHQEAQRRFYTAGNAITRLEQDIHHQQERQKQWQSDLKQVNDDWQGVNHELAESEAQWQALTEELTSLAPEAEIAEQTAKTMSVEMLDAEDAMHAWQEQMDALNQAVSINTQKAQVEQTRIQHLEQKIASLQQRQQKLEQEKSQLHFARLEDDIQLVTQQASEAKEQANEHDANLIAIHEQLDSLRNKQQSLMENLNQVRNRLQVLNGQQASLQALQETALGRKDNQLTGWLTQHGLDKNPRLAEGIEVQAGWERAVEKVLGAYLQAVCVDEMTSVTPMLDQFKQGKLCVIAKSSFAVAEGVSSDTLLSKVKSSWPLASFLSNVYVAASKEEAVIKSQSLQSHESVITSEGVWFGPTWMVLSQDDSPDAGVFQRETELKQLTKQITELNETHQSLEDSLVDCRDALKTLETERELAQKASNQLHAKQAEVQARYNMMEQRLAELRKRSEQLSDEALEVVELIEQANLDLEQARSLWQQAMAALEEQSTDRETLLNRRDHLRERLQVARDKVDEFKELAHQLEIQLRTGKSQESTLKQAITRFKMQLATLADRKAVLEKETDSFQQTDHLEAELENALSLRLEIETDLNAKRAAMDALHHETRALELRRQECEREVAEFRDKLELLRVECQGVRVKAETVTEQLNETGFTLESLLQELPEVTSVQEWHERLEQITLRISRLGAINLMAIEEYATCSERKDYLDKQDADLQEGLTTLENAIAKIDRETRSRFKETFDVVNERFSELFPRVFGGGHANLELTGDNLLDAGITVMACPPGKRNSTIHLLSGGEKTLTAIALVFSIFHLNPAPFCMLDEVDAPLDDANIGRFCQLVKLMSEKTQFIFISHNKLAIEMGENLVGVTMHEPGVSRLVTVDMQQAISMVEEA